MTGTIFDIRRFAIHDGPGIRTTVFLKGCPLDCPWCHNPEARSPEIEEYPLRDSTGRVRIGSIVEVAAVMDEVIRDEPFYDQSGGGITFSGGEPMFQIAFLEALLMACRERSLRTAIDTCGYAPLEDFEHIYDMVDLFLFDLKLMDPEEHIKKTGVSNDMILANLSQLAARGNKVLVRVPLIPGITDTRSNIMAIGKFIRKFGSLQRINLLPYNQLGEDKIDRYGLNRSRLNLKRQTPEELHQIAGWLTDIGLDVRIGG